MTKQSNNRFQRFFSEDSGNGVMLLDGATGTQLMAIGLQNECPELWNTEKPDKIQALADSYFKAGSDAVLTNTFGGVPIKLRKYGLEKNAYKLNKAGAENAVSICPEGKFVIGCVGPTGEHLEPYGPLSEREVIEAYAEQIRGLCDGGVDAISLDTFDDLNEIKCAIQAVRNNSNLPYLCSMTFSKGQRGYRTLMGVSIPQAAETLLAESPFAIGSNCSNGIENMIEIIRELRTFSSDMKIICQPNAGSPISVDNATTYNETPEFFLQHLPRLLEYRPSILGGCCGTTPEYIRMMRKYLDKLS